VVDGFRGAAELQSAAPSVLGAPSTRLGHGRVRFASVISSEELLTFEHIIGSHRCPESG
jgi:hypothetical protein